MSVNPGAMGGDSYTAPQQSGGINAGAVAGSAASGGAVGGPWGAIIAGAATVGAGLLQGLFAQKQAEEQRAYDYQMKQEDALRQAQMAQAQLPMQQANQTSGALQSLINNWRR